jgi:predicted solute-binding protein
MRLLVWPIDPARSLARALAAHVAEVSEGPSWGAASALAAGTCDLALVPTLEVLRDPGAFELVESVGLLGEVSPEVVLVVGGPLDRVRTLAFDPHHAQEALLAAVLLREHYGVQPTFAAADPATPLAERLAKHDAALVAVRDVVDLPAGAMALDLGAEWMDLTTRPFPWALLAARPGELPHGAGALLAASARAAEAPEGWQFLLSGYGHAGLDEFASHLFYHGALQDLPGLAATDSED